MPEFTREKREQGGRGSGSEMKKKRKTDLNLYYCNFYMDGL